MIHHLSDIQRLVVKQVMDDLTNDTTVTDVAAMATNLSNDVFVKYEHYELDDHGGGGFSIDYVSVTMDGFIDRSPTTSLQFDELNDKAHFFASLRTLDLA